MSYKGSLVILKDLHPALRIPSVPITEITQHIKDLVVEMSKVLALEPAIGISAPQVGANIRLLLIDTRSIHDNGEFYVMLNPEILHEEGQAVVKEGCLSFPKVTLKIKRSKKVKVKYLTLSGNSEIKELDGREARVFLHEFDHLEGKLMVDYV